MLGHDEERIRLHSPLASGRAFIALTVFAAVIVDAFLAMLIFGWWRL